MNNKLKALASQTVIYGLSSILARIIPFLLITVHTNVLSKAQQGTNIELYVWVGFLIVIYSFGMETTFFKYVSENDPKKTMQHAFSWTFLISTLGTLILCILSNYLAPILGPQVKPIYIKMLAIVLWIDGIVAIPFAKLRYEKKAFKFMVLRLSNLIVFVGLQLFFLLALPKLNYLGLQNEVFHDPVFLIILSNILANGLFLLVFIKELRLLSLRFDGSMLKKMLWYASPIVITGIGGLINERLDIRLLGALYEHPNLSPAETKGIYGSAAKLSVMILLVVQAFRYAVEPFFFGNSKEQDAKKLNAQVLLFFVLFTSFGALFLSFNIYWIGDLLISKEEFQQALYVVPVLLFARVMFGVYVNVSIWFKLSDMTWVGMVITLLGAVITIAFNALLIPVWGYMGPPIAALICFSAMVLVCVIWGQKYYPIPYEWTKILLFLFGTGLTACFLDYYQFSTNIYLLIFVNISILIVLGLITFKKLKSLRS